MANSSLKGLRARYSLSEEFGQWRHTWSVKDDAIGIHLSITVPTGDHDAYGGFEIHHRSAPNYMKGEAPSHDNCWLLNSPCWHDGSSTYAREFWIPKWEQSPNDHESMLSMLAGELRKRREIHE